MDTTTIIELQIPENYPGYMALAFECGNCKALAGVDFIWADNKNMALWDSRGCCNAVQYISAANEKYAVSEIKRCIDLGIKITESTLLAADYLVSCENISYKLSEIYIDSHNQVLLLPGQSKVSFIDNLCDFFRECYDEIPNCNGDIIAEKLRRENDKKIMGLKDVLNFLSTWEMEL